MKFSFTTMVAATALLAMSAPAAAQTDEINEQTTVHFIEALSDALNHPNASIGRNFIKRTATDEAVFENNITNYLPGSPNHKQVWHDDTILVPASGYPHYPYYMTTNYRSYRKGEMIHNFETKKRLIAGYRNELKIDHAVISPDHHSAVINVDSKEYGLRYNTGTPYLAEGLLHANAKCTISIGIMHKRIQITGMNCNTNAYIPVY